jgi:hypothetical protein
MKLHIFIAAFAFAGILGSQSLAEQGANAALDAAETRFLGCVQTLRAPAWSEFAQPRLRTRIP